MGAAGKGKCVAGPNLAPPACCSPAVTVEVGRPVVVVYVCSVPAAKAAITGGADDGRVVVGRGNEVVAAGGVEPVHIGGKVPGKGGHAGTELSGGGTSPGST